MKIVEEKIIIELFDICHTYGIIQGKFDILPYKTISDIYTYIPAFKKGYAEIISTNNGYYWQLTGIGKFFYQKKYNRKNIFIKIYNWFFNKLC